MDTITIELTNKKAYKLIQDMEELDLIRILNKTPTISSLRGMIKSLMTDEEIDGQLKEICQEWQRSF